jgi:hypothetical protein
MVDPDHEWATLVGRLLIAFAAMESLTHHCLKEWLNETVYRHLAKMRFAQRVDLVINLANEQDSPSEKIEIFVFNLKKARKLAEKRNAVAHNPLVLCLFKGEEEFTEAIASDKKEDEIIQLDELKQMVNEAEALEEDLWDSKVRLREHEWSPLP